MYRFLIRRLLQKAMELEHMDATAFYRAHAARLQIAKATFLYYIA